MTNFDTVLELEENMNKAAQECSDTLWNKKWNPRQDMLRVAFLEGVKWLARELKKEQAEGNRPKPTAEDIRLAEECEKKAFIERTMGRVDIAESYEACSYSLRRHYDD